MPRLAPGGPGLAVSRDRAHVAVAHSGKLTLFASDGRRELATAELPAGDETDLTFGGGRLLSFTRTTESTIARAWEVPSLKQAAQLELIGRVWPTSLAGDRALVMAEGGLEPRIVNVMPRQIVADPIGLREPVQLAAAAPEERLLVSGRDQLECWDPVRRQAMFRLNLPMTRPKLAGFAARERLLWIGTAAMPGAIDVFRFSDGRMVLRIDLGKRLVAADGHPESPRLIVAALGDGEGVKPSLIEFDLQMQERRAVKLAAPAEAFCVVESAEPALVIAGAEGLEWMPLAVVMAADKRAPVAKAPPAPEPRPLPPKAAAAAAARAAAAAGSGGAAAAGSTATGAAATGGASSTAHVGSTAHAGSTAQAGSTAHAGGGAPSWRSRLAGAAEESAHATTGAAGTQAQAAQPNEDAGADENTGASPNADSSEGANATESAGASEGAARAIINEAAKPTASAQSAGIDPRAALDRMRRPTDQPSLINRAESPNGDVPAKSPARADAGENELDWRDVLVDWARAALASPGRATPPPGDTDTPLGDAAERFGLDPAGACGLALLYAAWLLGEGRQGLDAARLSRAITASLRAAPGDGRGWNEALGAGTLVASGLARAGFGRVRLRAATGRFLDGLEPRVTITRTPLADTVEPQAGTWRLDAGALAAGGLAELLADRLGRDVARIELARATRHPPGPVVEALLHGAVPLLVPQGGRGGWLPFTDDALILVLADADSEFADLPTLTLD